MRSSLRFVCQCKAVASFLLLCLAIGSTSVGAQEQDVESGFAVTKHETKLAITYAGEPVADYVFADKAILRPHFQNLKTPGGTQVTRNQPPIKGQDADDHAEMHPGVWLAFGDISGQDFWRNKGMIRHDKFSQEPVVEQGVLKFATHSTLVGKEEQELCTQLSTYTWQRLPQGYLLSWDARFTPLVDGFYFGDQEEMGLGARVATAITEKNGGLITSSNGEKSAKTTWGRAYSWCDYSGKIDDREVGLTIFTGAKNFRPSWWHNRDYGVFVANPFGRKAMGHGDVSQLEVKKGKHLDLRFGVLLHAQPAGEPLDIEAANQQFQKATASINP